MTCTQQPCFHELPVGARYSFPAAYNPDLVFVKDDGNYDACTCRQIAPATDAAGGK